LDSAAQIVGAFDPTLLSQVEDAGLNASAPPQQLWLDGWLVRRSPGKAQRARCINAVAAGRRPLDAKLAQCQALFADAGLPLLLRITPFTQPATLDAELAARGWRLHDPTCVMLSPTLPTEPPPPLPAGLRWQALDADGVARVAGALRGSAPGERAAHAERLRRSPVPYRGFALVDAASGDALACGQIASEGPLVGLYDVVTAPAQRRRGLATLLCERMLSPELRDGAISAYLQVGAENEAARRIYRRIGFADAYGYHYRVAP
jgi:GNAT superfamily N-acetyltransferase